MKQKEKEVIKKVLEIFEASDLEEKNFKVRYIMLINDGDYLKAKVSFLEKEDSKSFYPEKAFRPDSSFIDLRKLKKIREAMLKFDNSKISVEMIPSIQKYLKEEAADYFVTISVTKKYIIIKSKRTITK